MKRKEFIGKTCPAVLLTVLASSEFLSACKNSVAEEMTPQVVIPQEEKDNLAKKKAIGTKGYLQ